jgi:hypothetical protein
MMKAWHPDVKTPKSKFPLLLYFSCDQNGSTAMRCDVVYCYLRWFDNEVDIQECFDLLGAVMLLEVSHLVDQNHLLPVGVQLFSAIERGGMGGEADIPIMIVETVTRHNRIQLVPTLFYKLCGSFVVSKCLGRRQMRGFHEPSERLHDRLLIG